MTYPVYPEYKDSELKWFRKIPKNWEIKRYKHALTLFQGAAFKSSEYVPESDVVNIRMGNIKKGGYIDLKHNIKYLPAEYKNRYSQYELKEGDLIIAMTDMSPSLDFLAVPAAMVGLDDCKTYLLNQRVGKLTVNKRFSTDFLKYLLLSCELRGQLKEQGLGTVQSNMSSENLYGSFFIAPPLEEQTQIATFLDRETKKIDCLIEKQQQLIKLLQEKRQAVISHAVTKGLNPDAKMKDSGVEWLGEIPEHWEMVPLKYLCTFSGGGTPSKDNLSYWVGGDIPWVSPKDMKTFWVSNTQDKLTPVAVEESTTNYVASGALLMVVRSGILQKTIPIAINTVTVTLNQDMKALRFNERMNVEYAANYIKGHTNILLLEWSKEGATVESIEQEYLSAGLIPIPPIYEQIEINRYLKNRMSILQGLIDKAEIGINLLKERRTALISAAVTGKIDVRNITMDNTDQSITEQDAISA